MIGDRHCACRLWGQLPHCVPKALYPHGASATGWSRCETHEIDFDAIRFEAEPNITKQAPVSNITRTPLSIYRNMFLVSGLSFTPSLWNVIEEKCNIHRKLLGQMCKDLDPKECEMKWTEKNAKQTYISFFPSLDWDRRPISNSSTSKIYTYQWIKECPAELVSYQPSTLRSRGLSRLSCIQACQLNQLMQREFVWICNKDWQRDERGVHSL